MYEDTPPRIWNIGGGGGGTFSGLVRLDGLHAIIKHPRWKKTLRTPLPLTTERGTTWRLLFSKCQSHLLLLLLCMERISYFHIRWVHLMFILYGSFYELYLWKQNRIIQTDLENQYDSNKFWLAGLLWKGENKWIRRPRLRVFPVGYDWYREWNIWGRHSAH